MRTLILSSLWAIGVLLVACGDEPEVQQQPVTEPVAVQTAQDAVAQNAAGTDDAVEVAEPQAEPVDEVRASVETSQQSEPVEPEAEPAAAEQAEPEQTKAEIAEPAVEDPPRDLTDVPATVVQDADVRIRPGLAWRAIDGLESGAPVLALHQAGGWVRVRYGDGVEGWIRVTALDLGEVEEGQILEQAAPPLIAEWRGEEYGVMGQSADGTEVRLLQMVEERPTVVGAPIDEVRLLDADVTLEDLPILIADETVVFPGDDFRVGQGRILPRANEWMWLPWGWLLAHNDTHIWQWRPETDDLEFIERPPGYAKLSPDGRYLAIACLNPSDCSGREDVIILPLDGSPETSLVQTLNVSRRGLSMSWGVHELTGSMQWAPNGTAVIVHMHLLHKEIEAPAFAGHFASLVFHPVGRLVRFEEALTFDVQDNACFIAGFAGDYSERWHIRDDNTVAAVVSCTDAHEEHFVAWAEYSLTGEFLGFNHEDQLQERYASFELIRSAQGAASLGKDIVATWSPTERFALVVDLEAANVWVFDARQQELLPVDVRMADSLQSHSQRLFESNRDTDELYLLSSWHGDQVGASIVRLFGIQASLLIDISKRNGVLLDVGGNASFFYWYSNKRWHPSGDAYQMISRLLRQEDGLAIQAKSVYQTLIVDRFGAPTAAIFVVETCDGSYVSYPLRHRAEWSPDGKRYAVGGQELSGQIGCPSED